MSSHEYGVGIGVEKNPHFQAACIYGFEFL